jgi:tetrapyrrole methylase family protein/MazG family protein
MPGKKAQKGGGITLLGLGPGEAGLLTREAWDWLAGLDILYLRTKDHPAVAELPGHLHLVSFDDIINEEGNSETACEEIVSKVLSLVREEPAGVTYAVPGHPFIAEATCPEIARRAEAEGIPVRAIDGLSFLEPTFRMLGAAPMPNLVVMDAMCLHSRQTPGFSPSSPALVTQISSETALLDVKSTLMSVYPDDHPLRLVSGAGTRDGQVMDLTLSTIEKGFRGGCLCSLYVLPLSTQASFESFQEVVARLRAPDGCPWDRAQTHLSLRPFLIEEAYEALDALDRKDAADLQEELGDLLLQIVLHAQIAAEEGEFNIHQVLDGIGTKLIRRHPHVFADVEVDSVSGVIHTWEVIKAEERLENGESGKKGVLDGVPKALPALLQAEEVIERVERADFSYLDDMGNAANLREHLDKIESTGNADLTEKLGEFLLAITSLAHAKGISTENALRAALIRYRTHFGAMEAQALAAGKQLVDLTDEEKERLWRATASESGRGEEQ